jgi:hypothetical protein
MCFGGGGKSSSPLQFYRTSSGDTFYAEPGIDQTYLDKGARTVAQAQMMAQQDMSDKQLAQQKQIADQQDSFNRQQLADQKAQQDALQAQADAQSARQNQYDTGRASLLAEGTQKINDAFGRFSPDYFNQYTSDYMNKATNDIDYQKNIANKQLLFGLARQGLGSSQAAVDQKGLLEEDAGRATAAQTQNALDATNTLKTQVANTKQNLLGQVTSAENVAPPIAGVNDQAVSSGLDTTRQAISGVTSNAGDTIASLGGVPTVSPLTNIFTNVLGGVGSYASGQNALGVSNTYANAKSAGLGGTSPGGSSATIR